MKSETNGVRHHIACRRNQFTNLNVFRVRLYCQKAHNCWFGSCVLDVCVRKFLSFLQLPCLEKMSLIRTFCIFAMFDWLLCSMSGGLSSLSESEK